MTHIMDPDLFEADAINRNQANKEMRKLLTPEQFEVFASRRTGRTWRVLLEACRLAEKGQQVTVVAASVRSTVRAMIDSCGVIIKSPVGTRFSGQASILTVLDTGGAITFIPGLAALPIEWEGTLLVDHAAIERVDPGMLNLEVTSDE